MKKSHLSIIISALVLITTGLLICNSGFSWQISELLQILVIALVVGFGVFIGIRRLKSEKRGEPLEDELSKRIIHKSTYFAFLISIYWWLLLMYLSDKIDMPAHSIIGMGILGMAVLFALCWIVVSRIGIKNE